MIVRICLFIQHLICLYRGGLYFGEGLTHLTTIILINRPIYLLACSVGNLLASRCASSYQLALGLFEDRKLYYRLSFEVASEYIDVNLILILDVVEISLNLFQMLKCQILHVIIPLFFLHHIVSQTVSTTDVTDEEDLPSNSTRQRFPDAIIIGVKKCGTRALLEFLKINPKIRTTG